MFYITVTMETATQISTTVEISMFYITQKNALIVQYIYNSRNFNVLYNLITKRSRHISTTVEISMFYITLSRKILPSIYNSRNFNVLYNGSCKSAELQSTTVEISMFYITNIIKRHIIISTTVEISMFYITVGLMYLWE